MLPLQEFDRNLFLHMGHPLEGKDGNVANNLDILWQIQYALRDLRRYLNSRGDMKLWEYIPCKDPNSGRRGEGRNPCRGLAGSRRQELADRVQKES